MNRRMAKSVFAAMVIPVFLLAAAGRSHAGYGDSNGNPDFFDDRDDQALVADAIDIQVLDDKLLAIKNGETVLRETLELNERVLVRKTKGLMGLVVTTDRVLAVSTFTANWIDEPLRYDEVNPKQPQAFISDYLVMVVTVKRLLAFDRRRNTWVETDIPLYDRVIRAKIDRSVAVVVTTERAWGLSVGSAFFDSIKFMKNEEILSVETSPQNANILTNKRLLVFKADTSSWQEIDKDLY